MTSPLVKTFVKDYKSVQSPAVRRAYGTLSGVMGIVCNLLLFGAKLAVALLSGGVSVLADALNNLSDAGSSVVTLVSFRMAGKPADSEHPFGHGRIEYIAGFVVAVAILIMGVELAINSVEKIITPSEPTFGIFAICVLAACILVKLWMAQFNYRLGKQVDSPVIKATAKDSLSDCCATTAVLVGVLVGYFANVNIDAYLGIAVAAFILFTGAMAAKDCLSPLLGEKPDRALIDEIREKVLSHEEVRGVHDLIVHDYGPGRKIVSLHAEVPADSDFTVMHDLIDRIERELKEEYDCETTIHMDPIDLDDDFRTAAEREFETFARTVFGEDVHIHDVRTVRGTTHTNIVFDCVLPFRCRVPEAEVRAAFERKAKELDPTYFVVVHVERDYSE